MIASRMFKLCLSVGSDTARILEIWRGAVDATHHFLSPQDRAAIEEEVAEIFPQLRFHLAVDQNDRALGFMLVHEGHMEALFIDPAYHGKGIGKALVGAALSEYPALTTDVNEQNTQALQFYQRIGFAISGRSPIDGQGRPYPLLHLRFGASSKSD